VIVPRLLVKACERRAPTRLVPFPPGGTLARATRYPGTIHPQRRQKMPTVSGHTTAIRASRVIGTDVKDNGGNVIGKIEDLILDKTDNAIMFAVVGFGGVLGMGEKFHPVPWSVLDFDPEFNAYVVPLSKEELEAAPADSIKDLTKNDGAGIRDKAFDYYKTEPYWH
jgi:sporulation protein YlmC with PRC-barrel domain